MYITKFILNIYLKYEISLCNEVIFKIYYKCSYISNLLKVEIV